MKRERNATIIKLLSSSPKGRIFQIMRETEEQVLARFRGDIFSLVIGYRYIRQWTAHHKSPPRWEDLPARLRAKVPSLWKGRARTRLPLDRVTFARMIEQVEAVLLSRLLSVQPEHDIRFESDPDAERARRVVKYREQIDAHIELIRDRKPAAKCGPTPVPVWCVELQRWFPSSSRAARWLSEKTGVVVAPSDIRTSIKRGFKRMGYTWSRTEKPAVAPAVTAIEPSLFG
jgi:hypothetical protein